MLTATISGPLRTSPGGFRWYAAFHDEGGYPHIHMMAWPVKPEEAYLSMDGIRKIKSTLTNDIFKQELLHTYEQKSSSRDDLVRRAREKMNAPAQKMRASLSNHPEMETVNEIVDWMEQPSVISECYQTWWKFQCQIEDFYSEKERQRPSLSQQKEFRSIKSAVIQEAENVRTVTVTFENAGMNKSTEFSVLPYNCWELWMVIQDDTAVMEKQDETAAQIISKAQNGDPFAQYLAGRLYRNSLVFVLDGVDAADWFDQAAHQGVVMAQYELGMLPLQ